MKCLPNFLGLMLLAFCLCVTPFVQAQFPGCGTDQMQHQLEQQNPSIRQLNQLFERRWQQQQLQGQVSSRQVHSIPLVVHLVHNNGPANLSDAQVQAAVNALNDGMRNRGVFNPQTGVDVEIEFCLAVRDPQGNATTGITRTQSALTNLIMESQDTLLKDMIRWDPTQYANIWIVNSITSQASGPGVAGYAFFPSAHGGREDGMVGEVSYFTSQQADISVFIHEAGHYLGLFHTFEGGCTNNNCLRDGDRVCDTPPDGSTSAAACTASPNSCQTDEDDTSIQNPFRSPSLGGMGDQADMITNYMDYGDPACTDAFTQGQKDRMRLALTTTRASLLQSRGCISPCNTPVTSQFIMTNLPLGVGGSVQLQFTGTGTVTAYDWEVNGQAFAQTPNPQYTFSQKGVYIFSLRVTGNTPNCFDVFRDTIEVFCEPRAQIQGWQALILPGDVLALSAGSGGGPFTWLVNGMVAGTGPTFNFSSPQAGSVVIQLIADNGVCEDTTARVVRIGDCGVDDGAYKTFWALDDSFMMDFTVAPPVIRTEGSMHGRQFAGQIGSFIEHSVTMSDKQGNLLFYSNGEMIWDRNHQPMPNGTGILGHHSASQGSIAFPDPANSDVYYLFTLDAAENRYANGLSYTKIDMSLRGGLGDVIAGQKNQFVMVTFAETMHAVYHSNGRDVWVAVGRRPALSSTSGDIVTMLVTAGGVQTPSVSTPVVVGGIPRFPGFLRFSHSGQWLCSSSVMYQFDRQTGTPTFFMDFNPGVQAVRGIEYSPDESKVYFAGWDPPSMNNELHQYDLGLGSPTAILASKTILLVNISPTAYFNSSKIEMGKDKKLYVVNPFHQGLHVVHNPDQAGTACNFQQYAVLYPNNYLKKSVNLPAYVRGQISKQDLTLHTDNPNPCPGEIIKIWPAPLLGAYDLTYVVIGHPDGVQRGDTLYVSFQAQGNVRVAARFLNACETLDDTLDIHVLAGPILDLGTDQTLCESAITLAPAFFPDVTYFWSTNQNTRQIDVNQPGLYWVEGTDTLSGCSHRDSITILPTPPAVAPDLGPDQSLCEGSVLELRLQQSYPTIRWWDGTDEISNTVFQPGTYWVEVTDICGNVFSDTIQIELQAVQVGSAPDSAFFCPNGAVQVDMHRTNFTQYLWDDGFQGAVRSFDEAGTFYVTSIDINNCMAFDTLVVSSFPENMPVVLPPMNICDTDTASVDATTPGWIQYQWDDEQTGAVRYFTQAGTYHLTVTDLNGCTQSTALVLSVKASLPLPLENTYTICLGDTLRLDLGLSSFSNFIWQDSVTASNRKIWEAGTYSLTAIDLFGCPSQGEARLLVENCPYNVYMPNAFSPNGDAHNEFFGIVPRSDIASYHLVIYNRWGNLIYESRDPNPGWDGRYKGESCPEGVYVYFLRFVGADDFAHEKRGTVTLIR